MGRYYVIENVDRSWSFEAEEMGSKSKFWYRKPDSKVHWLFKYPHENTGEHWAEKIAAGAAKLLDIPCAEVRLAVCDGVRGSSSKSFVDDNEELFHGNQVLAGQLNLYNPEGRFNQKDHTLRNIFLALDRVFGDGGAEKEQMANYLVLDAVIGNTDRHHENWGILVEQRGDHMYGDMAPSFDHATSLGRELPTERRQRLLEEKRIGRYSERARGGIFWSEEDAHAVSPLELVRRGFREFPESFSNPVRRLRTLDARRLKACVSRVPDGWMDPVAKAFSLELMNYNLSELRKLGHG